jgi:hypothetical protein
VADYHCAHCRDARVPDLVELAKRYGGVQWWRADLGMVQGEAVESSIKYGRCFRHAALIADLVAMTMREEAARRSLLAVPSGGRR